MVEFVATPVAEYRRPHPPAYAALDLGTNNCRLLVGTPAGDGFRVLDSFNRVVRLGEGLQHTAELSGPAMERTMNALHGCVARLARRPVRALRAVATEACRRAANGGAFIAQVQRETGLAITIISSREEAELAVESCAPLLRDGGRRALLFDIGGGSTELAWVRLPPQDGAPQLIGYLSMPLGVVTLAERYGAAGQTEEGFAAMAAEVAGRLAAFESVHCISHEIRQGGVRLLGTSGTVTTLAGVVLNLPRYNRLAVDGAVLAAEEADAALARLSELGREGLARHPCVGAGRAEFVLPGCAIFAAIHRTWPTEEIVVADRGLREGMILRMIRGERSRGHRFARADRLAYGAAP
jgi:exopolyphosphatase/guanosine-5'-triphosphate,3'-diphosphate pyrophosphatase